MTTEIKRFSGAYATMTVAAYEPMILHWISMIGIRFIANEMASRYPKAAAVRFTGKVPAAMVLSQTIRKPIPRSVDFAGHEEDPSIPIDIHGRPISPDVVSPVSVPGFPN